ncbi:MAG: SpoIIE family protein phosphatase [Proteobacteria bacterium]|jgi:sigma-B regulation protein RsbU (phosphoserine phosphatase)|nr:SpoIIE family protein phosphatase [Pseudomonadota bacterium]
MIIGQMRTTGLSLKYKILLLLTLVPVVTLGFYIWMAIKVFQNDKESYVRDASLSVVRTLSSQAGIQLNSTLSKVKPIMQEYLIRGEFAEVSRSILESDPNLFWVAVFQVGTSGVEQKGIVEKHQTQGTQDLKSFGSLTQLINQLKNEDRLVRFPFKNEKMLMVEKVAIGAESPLYFLIMAEAHSLVSAFTAASGAEAFLVGAEGFILLGPAKNKAHYLRQLYDVQLDSVDKNSGWSFAKNTFSINGEEMISSFSQVPFGQLSVASFVPRSAAFQAVKILSQRSVIFFVLLIAAATIVSLIASGSLTATLAELSRAAQKVAGGVFDIKVAVKSKDEVGVLAQSFNQMAGEISRLMRETAEQARMAGELKTAKTVQDTLFPPANTKIGDLEISGFYEPASEIGGDWWHYSQVGSKVFLWIGDATGHGAPAALITSAAKSAATILERLDVNPAQALSLLNKSIYDVSRGQIMMTFFLASYDLETHEFCYANASHEAPFLISYSELPPKKKDLYPMNEVVQPRLGQSRDTVYEMHRVNLNKGDRILFYTDGIPDIPNPKGDSWGEREFIKGILAANTGRPSAEQSVQQLVASFNSYRSQSALKDDVTFFMIVRDL